VLAEISAPPGGTQIFSFLSIKFYVRRLHPDPCRRCTEVPFLLFLALRIFLKAIPAPDHQKKSTEIYRPLFFLNLSWWAAIEPGSAQTPSPPVWSTGISYCHILNSSFFGRELTSGGGVSKAILRQARLFPYSLGESSLFCIFWKDQSPLLP